MDNTLRLLLRLFLIVAILFLIALIICLFYCRCFPRVAEEPVGRPLLTATAPSHHAEGGKYPPFDPKDDPKDRNDEYAYPVPQGPLRGTLAPTQAATKFFQLKKKKEDTPIGAAGDPVVFTDYDPLGTTSTVGDPPDMNGARGGNVVILSYNTRVQVSTDGANTWTEKNPTAIFPSGPAKDANGNTLDGGLCCDQIIQYVPQIDRFIWLMQFCGN